jgi:predicted MFS family arabinose efflux permease
MLDRFSIGPLLIPIALDFRSSLQATTVAATAYLLLYGAMQPVFGLLSDRLGRVRVMRGALLGASLAGMASALAPNLTALIAARALTGALICGVFPTAIVYIADSFPFRVRQQAVVDLLAAVAIGTSLATLGAGLFAHYLSWRLAFVLPALLALGLSFAFRWLPETHHGAARGPLAQLGRVFGQPWAVFLITISVLEGMVILGFATFLAPALEAGGQNPAAAGLVTAAYGASVLAFTRVVKRVAAGVPAFWLIIGGGLMLFGCYALAATSQQVPSILAASVLVGGAYAVMHSTFQTWATEVAPPARGTAAALFASGAFVGAGLGTLLVAGLAGEHRFGMLFALGALTTLPVLGVGGIARWRFKGGEPTEEPLLNA